MSSDPVSAIQRCYPQVYLACHADHVRARSTRYRLSAQDSMLLSHLDETEPLSAGTLARHLGVSASTLSASIKRLAGLGYLTRSLSTRDRRHAELRLTALGAEAMAAASVLDRIRVNQVLSLLTVAKRKRAVDGLAMLATAARKFRLQQPRKIIER